MIQQDTWDAVVIGAGPAGSLTARQLALQKRRVLLLDRSHFPRPKVCGCCINPVGLRVLSDVGLGDLTTRLGAVPLRDIDLRCGATSAKLPVAGVVLSREQLDTALIEAAQSAGAECWPGVTASLGPVESDLRLVHLRERDDTLLARLVVAADGLGSQLLARHGQPTPAAGQARVGAGVVLPASSGSFAPGTIHMGCGRAGYLGLVRLENGRLDLACALDAEAIARSHGIGPVAADLLTQNGWPVPEGLVEAPWKGTPRLTRTPGRLGDERLLVVGDAAGYIEPFTGEGMSWALRGAAGLAALIGAEGPLWDSSLLARWESEHRRLIRARQGLCRWLAWMLRHPWLTRSALRLLHYWPGLARPFLGRLHSAGKEHP